MVLLLRGSARTVSAVLVLLSLWSLPHRSQPDICVPAGFEEHDESKHVYTTAGQVTHDEHCTVCHWMRSLKPAFTAKPFTAADADRGAAVITAVRGDRSRYVLAQLPPRAPPAE